MRLNLTNMLKYKNCSHVCVSLCTTVVHNTAQSNSDYLPSYPPDKHQSSDAVYWRGGGPFVKYSTRINVSIR